MIGQEKLVRQIKREILNEDFPRFSVICGNGEQDKTDIVQLIADRLQCDYIITHAPKVDEIRDIIAEAYRQKNPIVYGILKLDNVSAQAKNALLKVTEEPPNAAYIVVGVKSKNNLLKTLQSRATIYQMDRYTSAELERYFSKSSGVFTAEQKQLIFNLCETPDEVDLLLQYNMEEFHKYVTLVVDNIATVSGSNSFKIAEKLKIKDTDLEKYDLQLFLKCFMVVCVERYRAEKDERYFQNVKITSSALDDLQNNSLNKQMIVDSWILDIRKVWLQ